MTDIIVPTGDFRITKPGESEPHDIGCLCPSCVARRREQAQQPHFREILEAKCAKLKPEQAAALRQAFLGKP